MKRYKARHKGLLGVAVLAASAVVLLLPMGASAVVAGAGFTTNDPNIDGLGTCLNGNSDPDPAVNCNHYGSKDYVWTNGGPSAGQNSLSDGTYFFAVLDPGGQNDPNDGSAENLSDADPTTLTPGGDAYTDREFTVSGGKIATYLGGGHETDAFYTVPNGLFLNLMPFDDTTNPGGVYIMAICQLSTEQAVAPIQGTVSPSDCKYDAFKAPDSTCEVDCEVDPFGSVAGKKYYDTNTNGQLDPGEVGIAGWLIDWTDGASGTETTDAAGNFSRSDLVADTYTFTERQSSNAQWHQTGNTVDQTGLGAPKVVLSNYVYTIQVADNDTITGVNFGNACIGGGGGGLTLGFWSNKNGQALVGPTDLALLVGLNLRNANGTDFAPATAKALSTWLLSANAVNMANMLSAQLAAMELNVFNGKVNGASLIYAPGTTSANAAGFASVDAVMAEANAELGLHGLVVAAGATRTYQEALKNALDKANNNLNFVQPGPASCPVTFAP